MSNNYHSGWMLEKLNDVVQLGLREILFQHPNACTWKLVSSDSLDCSYFVQTQSGSTSWERHNALQMVLGLFTDYLGSTDWSMQDWKCILRHSEWFPCTTNVANLPNRPWPMKGRIFWLVDCYDLFKCYPNLERQMCDMKSSKWLNVYGFV